MGKKLNEYLSGFYYTQQILLVSSRTTDAASVTLFATTFDAPVGRARVCTTLVFYVVNGIVKKMKSRRKKKKKSIAKLRTNLNNMKNISSKAIKHTEISHEVFVLINNETEIYSKLK